MEESRKFRRAGFAVSGIFSTGKTDYPINIINVSLKGLLIKTSEPIKPGMNGSVTLGLVGSVVRITIEEALVVHKEDENHYGLEIKTIEPESIIHLRRLLELNSAREGELEKELGELSNDNS